MKITSKVVLAGLLLSLSLTSCNNLSKNKNNEEDASKKTEVTESADSKEKEGTAEKDADSKEDAKEDKKEGTTEKDSKDNKENKDSKDDADKENSEDKEDADSNEEGGKSKEELIAKLEQAIFDSKVTVRALEILQTEAPDAIEGREAEVQEMIDRANEVLENATAVLDKAQGNN